jgi:hypothetical protein
VSYFLLACSPDLDKVELIGEATIIHEVGIEFVDPGVNSYAQDNFIIEVGGFVNSELIGEYNVFYNLYLDDIKTFSLERTVIVVDKEAPRIELLGSTSINIDFGSWFDEPGVRLSDNYNQSDELLLEIIGEVNVFKSGDYHIVYKVSDTSGNTTTIMRTVTVADLDINGLINKTNTFMTLDMENSYQIYFDNNLKAIYVGVGLYGFVYPNTTLPDLAGMYYDDAIDQLIQYELTNSRISSEPVIYISSNTLSIIEFNKLFNSNYKDKVLYYNDTLLNPNVIEGQLKRTERSLGIQNVIDDIINFSNTRHDIDKLHSFDNSQLLNLYDNDNITAIKTDTEPPIVRFIGVESVTYVYQNTEYVEFGVIATDNTTIKPEIIIEEFLDTSKVGGEHFIKYTAFDKAGNKAVARRSIYVMDQETNPVFVNNGFQELESYTKVFGFEFGKEYSFFHYFPRFTVTEEAIPKMYLIFDGIDTSESHYCSIPDAPNDPYGVNCGFIYVMDDYNRITDRTQKVVYISGEGISLYDQFDYIAGDKVNFDIIPERNIDDEATSNWYNPGTFIIKLRGEYINDYTVRYHFSTNWFTDLRYYLKDDENSFKMMIPGYGPRRNRSASVSFDFYDYFIRDVK